jgi:hypothetical protein
VPDVFTSKLAGFCLFLSTITKAITNIVTIAIAIGRLTCKGISNSAADAVGVCVGVGVGGGGDGVGCGKNGCVLAKKKE